MDLTIIQQGNFVSTGNAGVLDIRSDVDWIRVLNWTVAAADQVDAIGVEYYWQRGMPQGSGIIYLKSDAANANNLEEVMAPGTGFTLLDTSVQQLGPLRAVTGVTGANPPLVQTGNTAGLAVDDVVRLYNIVGGAQLGGIDFTIDNITPGASFELQFMDPIVAAGAGFYRKVFIGNYFYPKRRVITHISRLNPMRVTLSVDSLLTVGQQVRLSVPPAFGMIEADGVFAEIVAVDLINNYVFLDVDATGFTAWAFPLSAASPFTQAQMIPVGEGTDATVANPNLLDDATVNQALLGVVLQPGVGGPAGQIDDQMFWIAGKSFSVENQFNL